MHEHSLIANLLKKIEAIASDNGNGRVVSVKVRLGALSHITPEHFTEHFVEETKGTLAEGARLDIEQMTDTKDDNAQNILLESVELAA